MTVVVRRYGERNADRLVSGLSKAALMFTGDNGAYMYYLVLGRVSHVAPEIAAKFRFRAYNETHAQIVSVNTSETKQLLVQLISVFAFKHWLCVRKSICVVVRNTILCMGLGDRDRDRDRDSAKLWVAHK